MDAVPSSSLAPSQPTNVAHSVPSLPYYTAGTTGQSMRPGWSPETGLPRELWLQALLILFKTRRALTLLACALTCKFLREPAQEFITALSKPNINLGSYEDIDRFVEGIRVAPEDAKCIASLSFLSTNHTSSKPADALSTAPLRLAGQHALVNLRTFYMVFPFEAHFHPRSFPLYGRAFPHVTTINLINFQFPSFVDFTFFVTSFPSLTSLSIWVYCTNQAIPPSVERGPKKRNLRLESLIIEPPLRTQKERWFATTFLWWYLRRCDHLPKKIKFVESLFDHTHGQGVLRKSSEGLQELIVSLDSMTRRSQDDPTRQSWLREYLHTLSPQRFTPAPLSDAFDPGYTISNTVELLSFTERDVPLMMTIVSRHMGPTQILKMKIYPKAEDFDFVSWKTLDILLFSWYMLHGVESSSVLFLELIVPRALWRPAKTMQQQQQQEDVYTGGALVTNEVECPWLHRLFPLNVVAGKGRWLGDCKETRA